MKSEGFEVFKNKVIIRIKDVICESSDELLESRLFAHVLRDCIAELKAHDSELLGIFGKKNVTNKDVERLQKAFVFLAKMNCELIPNVVKGAESFFADKSLLNDFVEYLYNYWRSYDRFIVCESDENDIEIRPYRVFNNTIEQITNLIRAAYRDIEENITGTHPRIYRQVRAGAEVAAIAVPKEIPFGSPQYDKLNAIPVIRQILLSPPLILNPPMNKRKGMFERVASNPIDKLNLNRNDWLCYPAKVGALVILIYFHKKFAELGYSMCNLFELADEADLRHKPDAVYCYGVNGAAIRGVGKSQTVFYDDGKNDLFFAAVPNDDEFGYFGYLKKMVLTLHNIIMMKRGFMPFHGALINVLLPKGRKATMLLIGDTGAGKSETIEAMRNMGRDAVREINIVADDMGSIQIQKGKVIGYGSEIGAFLRLDDLQTGYAFGQIDRAIIMSPSQTNARIVMPVASFERIMEGHEIDYILYANNYEEIDDTHPLVERVSDFKTALNVFREGTVMSKGTTTSTGLVHSYFANVFGPPQYRELHDKLAAKYFKKFFERKIFVGQMRTRLGISGHERTGPEAAALALLEIMKKS